MNIYLAVTLLVTVHDIRPLQVEEVDSESGLDRIETCYKENVPFHAPNKHYKVLEGNQ